MCQQQEGLYKGENPYVELRRSFPVKRKGWERRIYIPIRIIKSKATTQPNADEDVQWQKSSLVADRDAKCYSPLVVWYFITKLNILSP